MKPTRRDVLALVAGAAAFGAWPAGAQTGTDSDGLQTGLNSADFDQVWELVRDRFYDPIEDEPCWSLGAGSVSQDRGPCAA